MSHQPHECEDKPGLARITIVYCSQANPVVDSKGLLLEMTISNTLPAHCFQGLVLYLTFSVVRTVACSTDSVKVFLVHHFRMHPCARTATPPHQRHRGMATGHASKGYIQAEWWCSNWHLSTQSGRQGGLKRSHRTKVGALGYPYATLGLGIRSCLGNEAQGQSEMLVDRASSHGSVDR